MLMPIFDLSSVDLQTFNRELHKHCDDCCEWKPISLFNKRDGYCKACRAVRDKKRAQATYERFSFAEIPCTYCGLIHCDVIELHHDDPTTKETTVARAKSSRWSDKRIQKEIDKCTPLCANCHKMIHGYLRFVKKIRTSDLTSEEWETFHKYYRIGKFKE